jgi:hypothetical protein
MKIYYDQSPAGAGKTQRAITSITSRPCKVLFITERIGSFREITRWIREQATLHGTNPLIETVHSDDRDRMGSVSRQIEALPDRHRAQGHVIVIATHAAMLRSDFANFAGWEAIVDEVPPFIDFEEKRTHLDAAFFQSHYKLEPFEDGWSVVRALPAGLSLSPADVRTDQSHEHLAVFHRRVVEASRDDSRRFVLCNLPEWQAMQNRKVQWCWASAFSLWELAEFDRVTLLGNRFRADIGARISEALNLDEIEWEELPTLKGSRQFQARQVQIKYFSEDRQASRNLFESDPGQAMLKSIGQRLAQELCGHDHIWTANSTHNYSKPWTLPTQAILQSSGMSERTYLRPKQAGTNLHKGVSHAAIIYAAKASPNQTALLNLLNIERVAWERSIEHETILQFVTRTSIRDEGNCSSVHLWVFDRAQARYLKDYFDGLDYVTADISHVVDGPAIPSVERRGPKVTVRTPEAQAEYEVEKKARDAARKREARAKARELKKAS